MIKKFEMLKAGDIPDWVILPLKYIHLCKNGQDEFLPWYLFSREDLLFRLNDMRMRYPARVLFPFARHDENDDVACFDKSKLGKVVIVHDFASPGWEARQEYDSFEDWYDYVMSIAYDEDEF